MDDSSTEVPNLRRMFLPDKPVQVEFTEGEKFTKLYSNSVQLVVGPWDFTFTFGEVKKPGDNPVVENQVAVIMSPQHAKAFANILMNHVSEYEKKIGEIKLPVEEAVPANSPVELAEPKVKTH